MKLYEVTSISKGYSHTVIANSNEEAIRMVVDWMNEGMMFQSVDVHDYIANETDLNSFQEPMIIS